MDDSAGLLQGHSCSSSRVAPVYCTTVISTHTRLLCSPPPYCATSPHRYPQANEPRGAEGVLETKQAYEFTLDTIGQDIHSGEQGIP